MTNLCDSFEHSLSSSVDSIVEKIKENEGHASMTEQIKDTKKENIETRNIYPASTDKDSSIE
eukprot:3583097-Ditylum_brightwellii.AAC.1